MRIDRATGTVVSVTARGGTNAVEVCVRGAVARARFDRAGQGIQSVSRTVEL